MVNSLRQTTFGAVAETPEQRFPEQGKPSSLVPLLISSQMWLCSFALANSFCWSSSTANWKRYVEKQQLPLSTRGLEAVLPAEEERIHAKEELVFPKMIKKYQKTGRIRHKRSRWTKKITICERGEQYNTVL